MAVRDAATLRRDCAHLLRCAYHGAGSDAYTDSAAAQLDRTISESQASTTLARLLFIADRVRQIKQEVVIALAAAAAAPDRAQQHDALAAAASVSIASSLADVAAPVNAMMTTTMAVWILRGAARFHMALFDAASAFETAEFDMSMNRARLEDCFAALSEIDADAGGGTLCLIQEVIAGASFRGRCFHSVRR
jgi:hypothetical protein